MSEKVFNNKTHLDNYIKKVGAKKFYKVFILNTLEDGSMQVRIFWNVTAFIKWQNDRVYGMLSNAVRNA
jgi:dissimilatory sulfite reductase (desulfoviridin) alpha/beta subunit